MGQMDKGVSGTEVDEGCNRVMKDQAKWMEGEMESTKPSKPDVFITGEMPNKQLENQVTYDYKTPKPVRFKSHEPTSCEVPIYEDFHLFSVASCSFSNLYLFLLIFLSFFPMI
jgi:hypothetical protein